MQIFGLLFLAALACASKHDKRIINGDRAGLGQFPYMVSLYEGKPNLAGNAYTYKYICGGAIISRSPSNTGSYSVLTSAWCVRPKLRVNAGYVSAFANNNPGVSFDVISTHIHPSYNESDPYSPNDIAVLITSSRISGANIKPATLPPMGSVPSGYATVSGWGARNNVIDPLNVLAVPSYELMYIDVPIVNNTMCKKALQTAGYAETHLITDSSVCTLHYAKYTCTYDIGSPLVQDNVVVGLVHWLVWPCSTYGAPGIFTRVGHVRDWVVNNIKD